MKKGQITIFLSLILILIMSLICTAIESARVQAVKAHAEGIVNMGLDSVFADFQKELLDRYDLFFIDGTYGGTEFSEGQTEYRLKKYMEYNAAPQKELPLLPASNLLGISPGEIRLDEYSLATDEEGSVFFKQAVKYMKSKMGVDLLNEAKELLQKIPETEQGKELVKNSGEKALEELKEIEEQKNKDMEEAGTKPPVKPPEADQPNPVDIIDLLKTVDLLTVIMPNPETISKNSVNILELPSHRKLRKGVGYEKKGSIIDEVTEQLLFMQYILEKFPNAKNVQNIQQETKKQLIYEAEYIIVGKESDRENLKEVFKQIMLIREGFNFAYLMTDTVKRDEAFALATSLVGYLGIVPLITVTQGLIMLAWAYGESIMDVRALMEGEKVPLAKTAEDWRLELKNLVRVGEYYGTKKESNKGLTYEDYLKILLGLVGEKEKRMRCLDMIENVLNSTSEHILKMDNCISQMKITAQMEGKHLFFMLPFMKQSGDIAFSLTQNYAY